MQIFPYNYVNSQDLKSDEPLGDEDQEGEPMPAVDPPISLNGCFFDPIPQNPFSPWQPWMPATVSGGSITIGTSSEAPIDPSLEERVFALEMRLNLLEDERDAEAQVEEGPVRICKNCKHWRRAATFYGEGSCHLIQVDPTAELSRTLVVIDDTDFAILWTHENFGCNLFESKPD